MRAIALTIGILAATGLPAQELLSERPVGEISLSDETLQLRYIMGSRRADTERANRISGGFFLSEERDIVLSADMLFGTQVGAQLGINRLQLLVGPRVYAALLQEENDDVLAAALGAEARYELNRATGLAIAGHAFYAPDILTFGQGDNLTDLMVRVEFRLQPRLTVFGGARWFEFEMPDGQGDQTLQDELFAGLAWGF